MLIVFELCHESHMMFVNVKKDYYSKVAHEMKFKTVKYVITKSTQATVTTPRNLNTVEPLLFISSSQNWSTFLSHHCSLQYEQIYCDLSLLLILLAMLVLLIYDEWDGHCAVWHEIGWYFTILKTNHNFFYKKKYIFNIIFVIVHTYEIRLHEVRR